MKNAANNRRTRSNHAATPFLMESLESRTLCSVSLAPAQIPTGEPAIAPPPAHINAIMYTGTDSSTTTDTKTTTDTSTTTKCTHILPAFALIPLHFTTLLSFKSFGTLFHKSIPTLLK